MTALTPWTLSAVITASVVVGGATLALAAYAARGLRGTAADRSSARTGRSIVAGLLAIALLLSGIRIGLALTAPWPGDLALGAVTSMHPHFRAHLGPGDPPTGFPPYTSTARRGMQPGTVTFTTSTTPRPTATTVFHPSFVAEIDKRTGTLVKAQRTYAMTSMFQPEIGRRYSYNVVDRNGRNGAGFHVTHYVTDERLNVLQRFDLDDLEGGDADLHDFELLDNGNALLLAYRRRPADLSRFGGDPNAVVFDPVIAERTPDGRTVWSWDGAEHLQFDDVPPVNVEAKLRTSPPGVADYAHPNSLELFDDGDILLSLRNYDCVYRIDRERGDIVWTFGGRNCSENDFKISGDPFDGFSHQHDATLTEAGTLLLFDNGNLHDPRRSRVVEYALDERQRTAALVWSYDDGRYTPIMGSAQRLDNGNTLIGWGALHDPVISEVTGDGEEVFTLSLPPGQRVYRAYPGTP